MPRLIPYKTDRITFSGIRDVVRRAAELEAQGKNIVHFEIGRPDFDTPVHIKEAAKLALDEGFVHYTPNAGIPDLREALAVAIGDKGVTYNPMKEIIVTAGGQEGLHISFQGLLDPGDEVLIPNPGFGPFTSAVQMAGAVPMSVSLLPEDEYMFDLEEADRLVTSRTRMIVINTPHNPTGAVLKDTHYQRLVEFALRHDLIVVADEAYDRLMLNGNGYVSIASYPGMKERTIMVGSLSKTYAMTGWRIGYVAGPAEAISGLVKVQQNVLLSVCSFAQKGAVAALNGDQSCVREMVEEFNRRRGVVLSGVREADGLECEYVPEGAFYVLARYTGDKLESSNALCRYLLDAEGVAAVPGESFGSLGAGHVRIAYATAYEKCVEGMRRIVEGMSRLEV